MRAGQATDLVLDPASGTGCPRRQPPDRLRSLPRRGRLHQPQPGPGLEPDDRRHRQPADRRHLRPIRTSTRSPAPTPNGAKGRIVLAKPALTGNAVAGPDLRGLALRGRRHPRRHPRRPLRDQGLRPELDPGPHPQPGAAGRDRRRRVPTGDPHQRRQPPRLQRPGQLRATTTSPWPSTRPTPISSTSAASSASAATGLVRVDATKIWDAHALVPFADNAPDGGLDLSTTGPVSVVNNTERRPQSFPQFHPRTRSRPFLSDATLRDVQRRPVHQQRRGGDLDPVRHRRDRLPPLLHDDRPDSPACRG